MSNFNLNEENKPKRVPYPVAVYPSDIIKMLMGRPPERNTDVELLPVPEILNIINQEFNLSNLNKLAKPLNNSDMQIALDYNAAIEARRKVQVTDRVTAIQREASRCKDLIMLGGEEEIYAALQAFEDFTV